LDPEAAYAAAQRVARDRDAVHADPVERRIVALSKNILTQRLTNALLERPCLDG
jgi:hypothetical protein